MLLLFKNWKKIKLRPEYLFMTLGALFILIMTFVLPSLADSFVMERFLSFSFDFFGSSLFVWRHISLTWVSKHFTNPKRARSIAIGLICILFVSVFLLKVGFVNELTGDLVWNLSSLSFNSIVNSEVPSTLGRIL